MAEGINSANPFSTAGHRWLWRPREIRRKEFSAVGADGVGSSLLVAGARGGQVAGTLKGTGSSKANADTSLTALETAIETLASSGLAYAWEDDSARTGASLLVLGLERVGPRQYAGSGTTWIAMQDYTVELRELDGKP